MNVNQLSDADIREYLLGQTPPDAAERLEELTFTDGFYERIGAVEHDLIDDHIHGRLSPDERRQFDSHYISSLRRRQKVDFASALAAHSENFQPVTVAASTAERSSIFDLFRNWRYALSFGMAAAGLLFISVLGWMVFRSGSSTGGSADVARELESPTPANAQVRIPAPPPPTPDSQASVVTEPPANADRPMVDRSVTEPKRTEEIAKPAQAQPKLAVFLLTPALRSGGTQTIRVPKGSTTAEFKLRLETDTKGPFTAEIFEMRGRARVWAARGVSASGQGSDRSAAFRLPVKVVGPGDYSISVFTSGADGSREKIGDYFFQVVP